MNISSFTIYQYRLPLIRPLSVRGKKQEDREGLIIHLVSDEGYEGFGEVAPLPGINLEDLPEALKQLKSLRGYFLEYPVPEQLERLNGGFAKWLHTLRVMPSVQFGIEMAILNLIANARHKTLGQLISNDYHDQISLNGLMEGTTEEVRTQAQQLIEDGFTFLKLKVGADIKDAIEKVRIVNEVINGRALLHLDANQQWDYTQAIEFSNEVGLAATDYIEEPFKQPSQISEFFMQTTIPVGLDESLTKLPFESAKSIDGVEVFILKPTALGGIEKTWKMMLDAKRLALNVVISSCFESSIGILTLANIAGCSRRDNPAGLDTLKYFKDDLLVKKLEIHRGKMDIRNRQLHTQDINFNLLKKV